VPQARFWELVPGHSVGSVSIQVLLQDNIIKQIKCWRVADILLVQKGFNEF
jgi:hypothetical protein